MIASDRFLSQIRTGVVFTDQKSFLYWLVIDLISLHINFGRIQGYLQLQENNLHVVFYAQKIWQDVYLSSPEEKNCHVIIIITTVTFFELLFIYNPLHVSRIKVWQVYCTIIASTWCIVLTPARSMVRKTTTGIGPLEEPMFFYENQSYDLRTTVLGIKFSFWFKNHGSLWKL